MVKLIILRECFNNIQKEKQLKKIYQLIIYINMGKVSECKWLQLECNYKKHGMNYFELNSFVLLQCISTWKHCVLYEETNT